MGCVYRECDDCVFRARDWEYPCDECYADGCPHNYQPEAPEDDSEE